MYYGMYNIRKDSLTAYSAKVVAIPKASDSNDTQWSSKSQANEDRWFIHIVAGPVKMDQVGT